MEVGQWSNQGEVPGQIGNGTCRVIIPLHSPGIWSIYGDQTLLSYSLPRLQLQLALIFLLTQGLHILLFKRLNFQRVVAEIVAGIIIGPTVLGNTWPAFYGKLFPRTGEMFLDTLAKLGYMLFTFLVGVKMDPSTIAKTGRKAWAIGLVSVMAPIVAGAAVSYYMDKWLPFYRRNSAKALVGIQTLTPFAVVAYLLIDLRLMNSELGRLALSATLISDLVNSGYSTLLTISRAVVAAGWTTNSSWAQTPVIMVTFIVLLFSVRPLFPWIIKQTPEGKPVKGVYVAFCSCLALAFSVLGDTIGLQYHLAPFLLGLTVPAGPPLGSTLVERLETMVLGLFAPLVVSTCGLYFDLFLPFDFEFLQIVWVIFFVGTLVKATSVMVPALLCKMPFKDAALLSVIMCSQGIVELAYYQNHFMTQTIDAQTFGSGTLSVLVMDVITSRLVKLLYDYSRTYTGYRKRNLEHLAQNADLRVLACAHRQDDALAIIKLLEISHPTKESPLIIYTLHLVELVGQATPLLINHGLGQKSSNAVSRSKDVIETFRQYGEQNPAGVAVLPFTAMSLAQFMQEDICYVAFDKLVSFVILPFHKKWNQQGKIVLDSNVIRTINLRVMEMAPCSVGILVDRRKIRNSVSDPSNSAGTRVAVIFLEGNDDREALSYATRMAQSPSVQLSVIRLVTQDRAGEASWETILDTELLNETKRQYLHLQNQVYTEETVADGSDTAGIVRELAEDYDLIITGRRHREGLQLLSGLTEWMELPELGPIGDILASEDIDKPVSVLVVQQQISRI